MKKKIVSGCLLMLAVIYTVIAFVKLPAGTASNPKGGFLPRLVGCLMVFVSALNLFFELRKENGDDMGFELSELKVFGLIIASFAGYVFLLWSIGYIAASIIFMFVMMTITKVKPLLKKIIISVCVTMAFFVIFQVILGVGLPVGKLWQVVFDL